MIVVADDMGFSGGTLISPEMLRRYVFPYHRRLCETAHETGRLALLHSCGNLENVMDDVIDAGFDGKHSFEDKIMPVEEAYRRWGDRIAILGGLDMDLLARGSEDQVRRRTREVLDVCGAAGTGYALGTGNSVANYIPLENYLTMLDEGRRWNRENFGSPA
jgi:uroporphyrinogen decarboxylase